MESSEVLCHLGVKIPRWMFNKIRDVQVHLQEERPEATVTRTDAVRRVLMSGLDALGIDGEKDLKEAKAE